MNSFTEWYWSEFDEVGPSANSEEMGGVFGLVVWPKDVLSLRWFESFLVGNMLYYFYGYLQTPEWWLTDTGFHMFGGCDEPHYIPPPPLPPVEWLNGIDELCILGGLYLMGYGRRVLNWVFLAVCICAGNGSTLSFTINRMFIVSFFFLGLQPEKKQYGERGSLVVGSFVCSS